SERADLHVLGLLPQPLEAQRGAAHRSSAAERNARAAPRRRECRSLGPRSAEAERSRPDVDRDRRLAAPAELQSTTNAGAGRALRYVGAAGAKRMPAPRLKEPSRPRLDRGIASGERQRLARHLTSLRSIAVRRLDLGELDPKQRIVRIDAQRPLERRRRLGVTSRGARLSALLEKRRAR